MINLDANKGQDGTIYTDKYWWYPKGDSNTHKENTINSAGCFYACDRVDFENTEMQQNGISDRGFEHLTIETRKRLDFKQGDRIRAMDGRFWNVDSLVVNDDGKAKEYSLRPPRITILRLSRTEVDSDNV